MPFKKPDDSGYPKCPDSVFADVPANAPLLKVYDYGPLGARFFCAVFAGSERMIELLRSQRARRIVFDFGGSGDILVSELNTDPGFPVSLSTLSGDPHNTPGHRKFFRPIHQSEQQENRISQSILSGPRLKRIAVLMKTQISTE